MMTALANSPSLGSRTTLPLASSNAETHRAPGYGVDVFVGVGVRVGVSVMLGVGVIVGVEVWVGVRVTVGVRVIVGVGVLVGVWVMVGVRVGVKVGVLVGGDTMTTVPLISEPVTTLPPASITKVLLATRVSGVPPVVANALNRAWKSVNGAAADPWV
ncbi:MAG: hypothetical protein FJ011_09870 [Chloroflexi bacterium]|nr:hypothetical protein [Chloroflexota bacterium]